MLLQMMGLLAALAFVLGLVGVAVWVAKRFGAASTNPRSRVAVEIVQRISLGPKTGMAVVRVGEKVMAVSMGPEGIRPLFELEETDRLRVIATSQIATPFPSSADAGQAVAKLLPGAFARMFQRDKLTVPASFAASMKASFNSAPPVAPTSSQPVSAADRDFRNMLNIAMSGATRLAVFGGLILISALGVTHSAQAQTVPTVVPPVVAPTTPATTPTTTSTPAQLPANQPAVQLPVVNQATGAPNAPAVTPPAAPIATPPAFVVPKGARSTARPASVRPAPTRAPTTLQGNQPATKVAADSTKRAAAPAPSSTILPGSASRAANRTNAAQPAAVAGGEDALAKMIPQMDLKMGDGKDGGLRLSGTVGIVVMMGLLTLVPTLVLMMTGFTRILIVLHFLKQAMGTQSAPPAQLLAAMALLLTGFVMAPTLTEVNKTALEPWMDGKITQVEMLKVGVKPLRVFMEKQTKEADLKTFLELSRLPRPNTVDDVPLHVLMSAFVASELRTAFQIGFIVYLPFIIIDAVVASVLMSMGMFMLPPAMISMPFKLLLFVLVDGWGLIIQGLVQSFK